MEASFWSVVGGKRREFVIRGEINVDRIALLSTIRSPYLVLSSGRELFPNVEGIFTLPDEKSGPHEVRGGRKFIHHY